MPSAAPAPLLARAAVHGGSRGAPLGSPGQPGVRAVAAVVVPFAHLRSICQPLSTLVSRHDNFSNLLEAISWHLELLAAPATKIAASQSSMDAVQMCACRRS